MTNSGVVVAPHPGGGLWVIGQEVAEIDLP